jgi:hypothetical protein
LRFILAFSYNLITLPKNQRTVRVKGDIGYIKRAFTEINDGFSSVLTGSPSTPQSLFPSPLKIGRNSPIIGDTIKNLESRLGYSLQAALVNVRPLLDSLPLKP